MKNTIILIFFLFFISSCRNRENDKIPNMLAEWIGREIIYPNDMVFTLWGSDTVDYIKPVSSYTIVSYVDSIGCVSCKLQLAEWKVLIAEMDSTFRDEVSVLLFFCPKRNEAMSYILKRDDFSYPVCIDQSDTFNKLNHFLDEMAFQTFLLDRNNRIIALGNPVLNPNIKKLYWDIIQGKDIHYSNERKKSKINIENSNLSLGVFDWQQERKAEFIFENVGGQPLVIDDVVTSCGCIMTSYSKEPVRPDSTVSLFVTYKAERLGHFDKTIKVYCNAESSPVLLKITGDAR